MTQHQTCDKYDEFICLKFAQKYRHRLDRQKIEKTRTHESEKN